MRKPISLIALALVLAFILNGCVSTKPSVSPQQTRVYKHDKDHGPARPMDVSQVPDAEPRVEPRTAAGNKSPYTVLGKTYTVMSDPIGFTQTGVASWYGNKFHGEKTSNGEIYNMYGMTAAHKNLPIPTFVRVTNIDNGRSVIVRVNDRGPFHGNRIIDLSYAAAKKLDYLSKGTTTVKVEVIDPVAYQQAKTAKRVAAASLGAGGDIAPAPKQAGGYELPANTYLQAGAFGSSQAAAELRAKIQDITHYPVFVEDKLVNAATRMFRVRIGPIADNFELVNLQTQIEQNQWGVPHIVRD